MLCVSICSVAGPVLCVGVGSLGAVSARAYEFVRPLYGVLRVRTSFLRLFYGFVRCFVRVLSVRRTVFVRIQTRTRRTVRPPLTLAFVL